MHPPPLSLSLATDLPCNCFGCSNGKRPLPGKHLGNVTQDCSNDEVDENTYEDDGDVDDLDPFFDSDE